MSGESQAKRWICGTLYSFDDPVALCRELVGAGMAGPQEEVEQAALQALEVSDASVREAALTALGHSARGNRAMGDQALDALIRSLGDVTVRGRAEHALDDVGVFVFGGRGREDVPGVSRNA